MAAMGCLSFNSVDVDKGLRNEIEKRKYRQRISLLAQSMRRYTKRNGVCIQNPKTEDIIKDNGMKCYKTTSTPCSCGMCSYLKYNRNTKHKKQIYEDN